MARNLLPSDIWSDVMAVRSAAPLVHNISNFVVMNFTANVLLAAGASPVMAHAHEEVADMAGIAQALVLNIGTLEPYWIESMCLALAVASSRGIPVVLDPVGAGATRYRNESVARLLATAPPSVVRGNASEIMSVAGAAVRTRGVDSASAAEDAAGSAKALAERLQGVVCVSGPTDLVVDCAGRSARLSNGHVWMTRITGVGCAATALIGAFGAVQPDRWRATVSAMALMGVVGEVAASKVAARGQGVGSLQSAMLDELQLLDGATFAAHLKLDATPC
jgi:hydroxyethylthiazole kinase